MPHIEYRGHADLVDVPAHQLAAVPARTPVEVSEEVAADLTAGDPAHWVRVDAPDPDADGEPATESDVEQSAGGDDTVTEA